MAFRLLGQGTQARSARWSMRMGEAVTGGTGVGIRARSARWSMRYGGSRGRIVQYVLNLYGGLADASGLLLRRAAWVLAQAPTIAGWVCALVGVPFRGRRWPVHALGLPGGEEGVMRVRCGAVRWVLGYTRAVFLSNPGWRSAGKRGLPPGGGALERDQFGFDFSCFQPVVGIESSREGECLLRLETIASGTMQARIVP